MGVGKEKGEGKEMGVDEEEEEGTPLKGEKGERWRGRGKARGGRLHQS